MANTPLAHGKVDMTKEELQAKVSAAEKRNGRTRFGRSLKETILEYAIPRSAAGESLTQVAGELGMCPSTLQRWCARLQASGPEGVGEPKARGRRRRATQGLGPVAFVELKSAPMRGEPLEVLLPEKVSVRVPVGFDEGTLSRVLMLLKGGVA